MIKLKVPETYFIGSSSILQPAIYDWVRATKIPFGHPLPYSMDRRLTFMTLTDALRFKMHMPEWTKEFSLIPMDEQTFLDRILR